MVNIYYSYFSQPLTVADIDGYLFSLPSEISNKIRSFKRWNDVQTCLFGKLLLLNGLKDFGIHKTLSDLKYTEFNRPFFDNVDFDFNISHTENFVVCAFSNEGVIGIDIEEIRPIEIDDFKIQFSENEWNVIINSNDTIETFFSYWTQKEAAIKADGRGLFVPLNKVYVDNTLSKVYVYDSSYYTHKLHLADNVICYLASQNKLNNIEFNSSFWY